MAEFINIQFSQFFDRPKVMKAVRDGTKSVMSKAGAFIRTRAKTSIRPATKKRTTGAPGGPPVSHTKRLRDLIFFAYDDASDSVVIGPTLFKSGSTAANALEFGGKSKDAKGKEHVYRKFPFMAPAMEKEKDNFPELFSGAIKG